MNFRTELIVAPQATPLPPGARVLTLGSCFAAVLGQQLRAARLPVLENPFGTVLNPVSACRLLAVACGAEEYDLSERAVARDGRWFSYDVPSSLSGATPEELQATIEAKLADVREFVRTADALVLTMGTALAWRLDDEVVANCHKQPGGQFEKTLLSVQEIVSGFAEMHSWLLRLNPTLRVVLTVSPVRHPKETLEGSSVSKSTLRLACHHLATVVRNVAYFPAYELLLDDLRDYRFFAPDLLHPSPLAEEYIFDKFAGAWFDGRFGAARTAWAEVDRALAHRSSHPRGEAHQQFLLATLTKLDELARQGFSVGAEVEALTAQLIAPRPRVAIAVPAPAAASAPPPGASPSAASAAPTVPAPRPIKPIIRITSLPEAGTERGPNVVKTIVPAVPPALAAPAPVPSAEQEPAGEEPEAERRGGRRGSRRGRGGRDNRRDRPAGDDLRPMLPPLAAPLVPDESVDDAESDSPEGIQSSESEDGTPAKKRRGRRGGRRHKQRRDEFAPAFDFDARSETSDLPLGTLTNELQAGAEAAAELAVDDQLAEQAPPETPIALAPAEEVALEATLAAAPAAGGRGAARPARHKSGNGGGKKIILQKVKPMGAQAPVAESAQKPVEMPIAAPTLPVVPEQPEQPDQSGRPLRPARGRKPPTATDVPTPETPDAAVPRPVEAAPSMPAPAAAPVAQQPAPKPQSRTARTPGKAYARGPVATPVEQANAARVVKKAGVGALMAALGGAAVAAPVVPPAVEPEVKPATKPVAKAAAKPATKPAVKAAAKPATKPVAKAAVKPAAKPAAKPLPESAAKPVAKASAKPKPAAPPAAEVVTDAPAPAKPKRPAKPRPPKTK